jgi:hypothetical protein
LADAWAIAAGIFVLLGAIFAPVGAGLTVPIVTAFVGIPFLGLGLLFLVLGGSTLFWRYANAQQTIEILRTGTATLGELVSVQQNRAMRINGRSPWRIVYRYRVNGRQYEGTLHTLKEPDAGQQPGNAGHVLVMQEDPRRSTLYPGHGSVWRA